VTWLPFGFEPVSRTHGDRPLALGAAISAELFARHYLMLRWVL
jgi:hypothetical protein